MIIAYNILSSVLPSNSDRMDRYYLIILIVGITIFNFIGLLDCKQYDRCEFLNILTSQYNIDPKIAQSWTCLGEKITGLDHGVQIKGKNITFNGIYQISSEYWCENDGNKPGKGCNVNCKQLLDENLTDDIECVQKIYNQHSGFSAWPVYESACKDIDYQDYFKGCNVSVVQESFQKSDKIYEKCQFVQELYSSHGVPVEMLGTITCIAKEESQFNTAAIGRLNGDKSMDHGIFQISDKYWCLNDPDNDKAGNNCNIPCSSLRDDDITDDVRCMKQIYEKTSQFSGSGYDAWLVYTRNDSVCKDTNKTFDMIEDCLDKSVLLQDESKAKNLESTGKSYQRCELARELRSLNIPLDEISTLVCIAYHESKLTTSKVSGHGEYGLFQILEGKWCSSNDISAVGCEISCERLRDKNITDDVECVKKIHALLGFSPWKSYKIHCDAEKAKKFTERCPLESQTAKGDTGVEPKEMLVSKATTVPYYLLHFSDPENNIRATLEIGKSNIKEGAAIRVTPILSTKSPNKMNGLSVIIEDGK